MTWSLVITGIVSFCVGFSLLPLARRIGRTWMGYRLRRDARCAYIGTAEEGGHRCSVPALVGGFCGEHDEMIHQLGGDSSPGGSAIIRRSVLWPKEDK